MACKHFASPDFGGRWFWARHAAKFIVLADWLADWLAVSGVSKDAGYGEGGRRTAALHSASGFATPKAVLAIHPSQVPGPSGAENTQNVAYTASVFSLVAFLGLSRAVQLPVTLWWLLQCPISASFSLALFCAPPSIIQARFKSVNRSPHSSPSSASFCPLRCHRPQTDEQPSLGLGGKNVCCRQF